MAPCIQQHLADAAPDDQAHCGLFQGTADPSDLLAIALGEPGAVVSAARPHMHRALHFKPVHGVDDGCDTNAEMLRQPFDVNALTGLETGSELDNALSNSSDRSIADGFTEELGPGPLRIAGSASPSRQRGHVVTIPSTGSSMSDLSRMAQNAWSAK